MGLFLPTLNQMAYLFSLIVIGFLLARFRVVPENAAGVLGKLESWVFIPALVLDTFMMQFTLQQISTAWPFLVGGLITGCVTAPLAVLLAKACTKDDYLRKISAYGLAFANFAFMGNAVVQSLFPGVFLGYLIFTLPLWALIYTWGVPTLLMPAAEGKRTLWQKVKPFVNPMFICMIIGAILGLIPFASRDFGFFSTLTKSLGGCMSPVAMVLTGMTVARIDLKKTAKDMSIYAVTAIRLFAIPLAAIGVLALLLHFFPVIPREVTLCVLCALSMPVGLTGIVIPAGYGMDTTAASGMALVSHLLACITLPLTFMLAAAVGVIPVF